MVERFLENSRNPALLEPGEELLHVSSENHVLEVRNGRLMLQAWDQTRNLVRRITGIRSEATGRLQVVVEKFPRKEGHLFLIDLARPAGFDAERRSARLVFREQFRQFLHREFPSWKIAELSAEPNLEYSLSPAFPRALLRDGQKGVAAIAAPSEASDPAAALSFGLIWLDYLRRRERRLTIGGLVLFVPSGQERATCLRVKWLDPRVARYDLFAYSEQGFAARLDPADFGNLDTRLETCRQPNLTDSPLIERLIALPDVDLVPKHDGTVSLQVRGVEFAQASASGLVFGLSDRIPAQDHHLAEIESLARELARVRSPSMDDREHPLFRQQPEAWLESKVRANITEIDASLLPAPVYGQVPAFAGGERGVIDLLAVDTSGRLAVLELKASADIHLPLQALDYWLRVKWHLDRGQFSERGYFPAVELRPDPPRLLLISPALDFHPTTESILGFFSPEVAVERIGVGIEWRKGLKVMFRLRGAEQAFHE